MTSPSRSSPRRLASLVVVGGALVATTPARADATYASVGVITSTWTDRPSGVGVEGSVMRFAGSSGARGFGAFTQLELLPPTKESDEVPYRLSMGPQLTAGTVGAEVGLEYRTGIRGAGTGDSLGLRFAPFLSLGFAYLSLSGAYLPVTTDVGERGRAAGLLVGATVGIKIPFLIHGHPLRFWPSC